MSYNKHYKIMKKKLTELLIMVSKYTLIGFFMQLISFSLLLAYESAAQKNLSVKEIVVSIHLNESTLQETFNKIESLTDLKFNYHKSV